MNSILKKVLTYLVLPVIIAGMTYAIVKSVMEPVEFNKYRSYRESIAIQRLKDVRDLQVAFKNVNGRYASTVDSLKMFYNEGKMKVVMQVGSQDDSVAVANTQALKKRNPKIKPEQMLELYQQGQKLVFKIENEVAVKDTLFTHRDDFCVDSLAFIPFCGDSLIMESTVKTVSGVKVLSSRLLCLSSPSSEVLITSFASTLMLSVRIRASTRVCRLVAFLLLTTTQVTGSSPFDAVAASIQDDYVAT